MKQISKKLSLKKKTIAVLNQQELNGVVGGATTNCNTHGCGPVYNSINVCPPVTRGIYTLC